MLSVAILCNVVLFLAPLPEPAAGPTVTALEIVDLRRARLKPQGAAEGQRFSFDRPGLRPLSSGRIVITPLFTAISWT